MYFFHQEYMSYHLQSNIYHDNKKLANRKSVKNAVLELQNSYQKYFEENKERICDTDYTDETFETEKIALVSNPIHTGPKEPVVWYQLGELMKNAKERVKIHTPYIIQFNFNILMGR